jgi:hypothetical protein
MVPSLGRIRFFKGKMITLCGRVTHVPIIIHGTLTKEEFEVIQLVENNAHFPLLLGKTWIDKDHIIRKVEEEATKKKNKELRDFIAREIDRQIEEREVKSKQHKTRELVVEVERMQEGLKDLSMQERRIPTPKLIKEEVLTSNPLRAHQQCEVTLLGEDKNKNGKRILENIRENHITRKKERKINKNKSKLEKLQEATENRWKTSQTRTLQEAGSQDLNLIGTTEPCRMGLHFGEAI